MENIREKLNVKLFVIGFVILSLVSTVILLLSGPKKSNPQIETARQSLVPTTSPSESGWKKYETDRYEINQPQDWNVSVLPVVGGYMISMSPQGEKLALIHIKAMEASKNASLEAWVNSYSKYNLEKKTIVFNGNPAIKLDGVMPWGEHKVLFFFENQNYRYIVDYMFYEGKTNTALMSDLEKMIDSFKLDQ